MVDAPKKIRLTRDRQNLEITFADGSDAALGAEYLRVFSPSAEVRGHGGGEMMLVLGKQDVRIEKIEPVGRYAVKLTFSDGHDSGLYDWGLLRELADRRDENIQYYRKRLADAGLDDPKKLAALGCYDVLSPKS